MVVHVVRAERCDGIPHMIHLFGFLVFLKMSKLLPPGRRLGRNNLFVDALLGRAPLRGGPHQEILLVRRLLEPVPDFSIFT